MCLVFFVAIKIPRLFREKPEVFPPVKPRFSPGDAVITPNGPGRVDSVFVDDCPVLSYARVELYRPVDYYGTGISSRIQFFYFDELRQAGRV